MLVCALYMGMDGLLYVCGSQALEGEGEVVGSTLAKRSCKKRVSTLHEEGGKGETQPSTWPVLYF